MRRPSAAIGLLLLVVGLAACDDQSSPAERGVESAATHYAEALTGELAGEESKDSLAEVSFVDAQGKPLADDVVIQQFTEIVDDMDGLPATVSLKKRGEITGDKATATLTWSWQVQDDAPWKYDTTVDLVKSDSGWAITWDPATVEPSLKSGDVLDAITQPTDRGDITGAGGKVLVTERPVVRVGIDRIRVPAANAPASAQALAKLVGIDVAPYVKAVTNAGPRAFVEAITYRKDEIPAPVAAGLPGIKGAHQVAADIPLAPTRTFAAALLGKVGPVTAEMVKKDPKAYQSGDVAGLTGLQARYDEQLRGDEGRTVHVVPAADDLARRTVFESPTTNGENLALTLDPRLQSLAERILAPVGPAAALVAIRPSDGAILAAADGPGNGGQNLATFGKFAPGSTFKIATSLALLRAGLTPDTNVRCTPTVTVDGKRFKNYSDYPSGAIGTIPLRRAIANSCNTALINARAKLADGDLAKAAASLGLGIDHDLGFPAYFGNVPAPASKTEAAASMIGQGKVQASPMAMAAVIASAQAGKTVVPRLVEQVKVSVPPNATPLAPAEAKALKAMLRQVVTEGSGSGLADVPGGPVIAKTGTAEYADGSTIKTHAWMVAAQGDLAIAVFVRDGASGSQTAGPLIEQFLRQAR